MLTVRTAPLPARESHAPMSAVAALAADIGAACEGPSELMGAGLPPALARAVRDRELLTPEQSIPSAQCYARHVVYGDPAGRFTILSLVWMPGQFSPPHAHQTWCAYAVCDNVLTE